MAKIDLGETFAPQYQRTVAGWIQFPQHDSTERKKFFPEEVSSHSSKNNVYMVRELIDYLTEPRDVILDPFGGTGTMLLGAWTGRRVMALELEDINIEYMNTARAMWPPEIRALTTVAQGDCRTLLPVVCDCVITSPPYAAVLKGTSYNRDRVAQRAGLEAGATKTELARAGAVGTTGATDRGEFYKAQYAEHPKNLGRLSSFFFRAEMQKVYRLLFESIKPGGYLALITRDFHQKERVYLTNDVLKDAARAGFELSQWLKWECPQSAFVNASKLKGGRAIEDEDIMIWKRV